MMIVKEVTRTRKYKAGYEIRDEVWEGPNGPLEMKRMAYTPTGDFIGDSRVAHRLCAARGIAPEKRAPEHSVCSIGFSEKEQKWYGWSHRALYGFGIGHVVNEGDCAAGSGWTDEYLSDHPEEDVSVPVGFTAQTLDDCRRVAVAFADSVS